jgi:hypothetical protein
MVPLVLFIPGEWWDSYIYRGKLHLFSREGDVVTIDWAKLISDTPVAPGLELARDCAFADGRYLYGSHWRRVFSDAEVRGVLEDKFARLARTPLQPSKQALKSCVIEAARLDLPFPFADLAVYSNLLLTASSEGLHTSSWNRSDNRWRDYTYHGRREADTPILALDVAYRTVAMAAGDAGLYEMALALDDSWYRLNGDAAAARLRQDSEHHCSNCHWLYFSVLSSSHYDINALAAYAYVRAESGEPEREHVRTFDVRSVFGDSQTAAPEYAWGLYDKLYLARDGEILSARYRPGRADEMRWFQQLGPVARSPARIVEADTALFGIVLEHDADLSILASNGDLYQLGDEPVNWRLFPRSYRYLNQLHIVRDDRIEIWGFTHDFFVDQDDKVIGARFSERMPFPRRPA